MARQEVIDPVELAKRIHSKVSDMIKSELDNKEPNIQVTKSLNAVNEIVISTLEEMTAEATKRIAGK